MISRKQLSFESLHLSLICILYLGFVLWCGATCKLHNSAQIMLIGLHLIKLTSSIANELVHKLISQIPLGIYGKFIVMNILHTGCIWSVTAYCLDMHKFAACSGNIGLSKSNECF